MGLGLGRLKAVGGIETVTDTSPEIEARWLEMWKKTTPAQRVRMGSDMFSAAKKLATAGIRKELGRDDPKEIRRRLFFRFYGSDFTPEESERILGHIEKTLTA